MSSDFLGHRILVVGCAHGHGKAIALQFAQQGAELILIDRNPDIKSVCNEIISHGGAATFHQIDLTSDCGIKEVVQKEESLGITGFVYLPRGRIRKPFAEISKEEWNADLEISLSSAFFIAQAVSPVLARQRDKSPFIVLIGSVLSTHVGTESVSYHVAKAGLDQLTRCLAVELGAAGIRVNAVSPGWNIKDENREMFAQEQNTSYRSIVAAAHPLGEVGDSQDIFEAVAFLGSKRSKFITGQVLEVNGGVLLREPSHFYLEVSKKIGLL